MGTKGMMPTKPGRGEKDDDDDSEKDDDHHQLHGHQQLNSLE